MIKDIKMLWGLWRFLGMGRLGFWKGVRSILAYYLFYRKARRVVKKFKERQGG